MAIDPRRPAGVCHQQHDAAPAKRERLDDGSLGKRGRVSHVNLNDGTVEGIEAIDAAAFGVQYHPESSPGPHDARHLFARFVGMMEQRR